MEERVSVAYKVRIPYLIFRCGINHPNTPSPANPHKFTCGSNQLGYEHHFFRTYHKPSAL